MRKAHYLLYYISNRLNVNVDDFDYSDGDNG